MIASLSCSTCLAWTPPILSMLPSWASTLTLSSSSRSRPPPARGWAPPSPPPPSVPPLRDSTRCCRFSKDSRCFLSALYISSSRFCIASSRRQLLSLWPRPCLTDFRNSAFCFSSALSLSVKSTVAFSSRCTSVRCWLRLSTLMPVSSQWCWCAAISRCRSLTVASPSSEACCSFAAAALWLAVRSSCWSCSRPRFLAWASRFPSALATRSFRHMKLLLRLPNFRSRLSTCAMQCCCRSLALAIALLVESTSLSTRSRTSASFWSWAWVLFIQLVSVLLLLRMASSCSLILSSVSLCSSTFVSVRALSLEMCATFCSTSLTCSITGLMISATWWRMKLIIDSSAPFRLSSTVLSPVMSSGDM
mmetsp:Transcript_99348/g.281347  ORF Transcript_99348/g.281347 Transcript_99348/m.281347 type:complete len:362 (+) Transcript_99348:303-1388(+)